MKTGIILLFSCSLSEIEALLPIAAVANGHNQHSETGLTTSLRALRFLSYRAFGSVALAVQYDYDDDEDEHELCRPRIMADSAGWAPEYGIQWVMIREPGAKRHVFAERFSKVLEVRHIYMGSLLCQELNPRSAIYQQVISSLVN